MTEKSQKEALIGDHPYPQIVKSTANNGTTIVAAESQFTKSERGKAFRQVIAAIVANIGTMNTGLIFGFSAVVIPQLESPNSLIPIDEYQASWVASLASLSTPIGCLLSGYMSDNLGRKLTLLITEIPLILGWLTIACATRIEMIYIGRLLTGLGSGMVGAPARVYTSEVTQPHLRGMLVALSSVCLSGGVLFQYTLGAYTSWKVLSAVCCVVPVIAFLGMLMMPESPNYLVAHNKPEKAKESLAKLRGSTYNLQKEINHLQNFVNKGNASKVTSGRELWQALTAPSSLKPFGILVVYFMLYQWSGVNAITFYAVEIFRNSGTSMDGNTATIILGLIRFLFTIVACIALRRMGRRPLSFISGIGCGISMLVMGFYMYYKSQCDLKGETPLYNWVPVACVYIFIITCTVGFLVVPWIMIGELYPLKVRGIIGGFTTCMAHIFVFSVVKVYPYLTHLMDRHGTFIMYGLISFVATVFFYFYLPETKGKTLQEIEDYFSGRISTLKTKKIDKNINDFNAKAPIVLTVEQDKLLQVNEKTDKQ